jgi:NAD(P)H-hydrate epimerase
VGGEELLTCEEMARADRLAVEAGVASLTLMENAGRAVAETAARMVGPGARIGVLCGPGNNGGDGFVAARYLTQWGYDVWLGCLVPIERLQGDAAAMTQRWTGGVADWRSMLQAGNALIVDAVFGAGLARPAEGDFAAAIEGCNAARGRGAKVVAVDVPSGVDGNSGARLGAHAVTADRTVTFFRRKPGHVLMPGREMCGEVTVAEIGIPADVLDTDSSRFGEGFVAVQAVASVNSVAKAWREKMRGGTQQVHKYSKGHAVVVSGPAMQTGAARLAARGALRAGAGLVTLASPAEAFAINAAQLMAIMIEPFSPPEGLASILSDDRKNAVVIGPGCGMGDATRRMVEIVMAANAGVVLDADALTAFAGEREALFAMTRAAGARSGNPRVVLTPHEGEFSRLFGDLAGSKLERAKEGARLSGAVVVLKGPDTVIAAPDGCAKINTNAPAWLATAGSGDVLAGFIGGLSAQGMTAFEAASTGVWLHGACASRFGPGLIAEDLPEVLPQVLGELLEGE